MSRPASGRAAVSFACAAALCALLVAVFGTGTAHADARTDCYAKSGETAIRACTEAITLNPRDVTSYLNRAYEHLQKSDFTRSLADYTSAIAIDPARWEAFQGRAWAHLKSGRPAEGLADADAALKLNSDAAQALDTRAHILEVLGRREEAIADYRRALALEPRLAGSKAGLKRLEK